MPESAEDASERPENGRTAEPEYVKRSRKEFRLSAFERIVKALTPLVVIALIAWGVIEPDSVLASILETALGAGGGLAVPSVVVGFLWYKITARTMICCDEMGERFDRMDQRIVERIDGLQTVVRIGPSLEREIEEVLKRLRRGLE